MSPLSTSSQENGTNSAHSWLQAQVYEPKRQRTVDLVKSSVDALLKDKQRISLSTVVAKSKELDTEGDGKGISESAILDNDEARVYYESHRSWRGSRRKRSNSKPTLVTVGRVVKLDRDVARVRQRYLRRSKEALVEQLLLLEQSYAESEERWLQRQDEVLTWRLRAEQAELRLKAESKITENLRKE